jgi:hypothetical protein
MSTLSFKNTNACTLIAQNSLNRVYSFVRTLDLLKPAILIFFSFLMISTHVSAQQTLTEKLEQGLGLTPTDAKPADAKPADAPPVQTLVLGAPQAPITISPAIADGTQQNLADQIETLKQAMINLNRDLFILEEDLLFPASTQVAVYLSMDVGEYFALDAVEIRLDKEIKTYYLYTSRQVNALYRGGVQRLYVGNVNQGKHELTAYFVGIGPQNREYKRAVSVEFTKSEDPVAIELSVVDSTNKQQPIFEAKEL